MGGKYLLILVLAFAPLVHGGNRPLPLLFLELAALGLAAFLIRKPQVFNQFPRSSVLLLLAVFLLPLLQLLPLPFFVWRHLPGHAWYAQALAATGGEAAVTFRAASLVPSLTEYSWLALLPPLTVFLFALSLPKEQLRSLVPVFLGLASFQALLGLMQYGDGPDSLLRFGNYDTGPVASGTYANRDHLAGFLEMALPLSLAMLAATLGHSRSPRRHAPRLRQRLATLASTYLNQAVVYGAMSIVLLLGLIFTHSRTGVVLGMVVILLCTIAFSLRLGGRNVYGLIGTFTAISVALAVEIGLVPVLDRFVRQDPLKDARWAIFGDVTTAIGEFFPLGSGMGTFSQVFPRFHGADLNGMFINRAHNDYLEWVMEGGIVAALIILAFLAIYLLRALRVWQRGEWRTFKFMQVGAGIGLFAMILHTFVDFNLHIPANQIYFAFLAALFFHQAQDEEEEDYAPPLPERNRKPVPAMEDTARRQEQEALVIQPGPNPFAE